jgi:hypothetical protein
MGLTAFYERLQSELLLHGAQYKLYIEAATVAVLFYVALTDFLTFRIRNELIVLLLILYALFAFVTRSRIEVPISHWLLSYLPYCFGFTAKGPSAAATLNWSRSPAFGLAHIVLSCLQHFCSDLAFCISSPQKGVGCALKSLLVDRVSPMRRQWPGP